MSNRRQRSSLHRAGYSLVELVLVLAIMAALAGIAIPRYGRATARFRADAAAKRVASELRQAQQRAKAASGACVVSFATTGICTTTLPTLGGVAGQTLTTNLTLPPYASTIRSAAFGNGTAVTFDGYGMPSAGGTVVIGNASEQRTITLTAVSGAVAISTP